MTDKITMEQHAIPGTGTMQFSAAALDELGAAAYTLVTPVIDISGSVWQFRDDLLACLKNIVESCQLNKEIADSLMFRALQFNHYVDEIHGFKPLSTIDVTKDYPEFEPDGTTALYKATMDAVASTMQYSKKLVAQEFTVNGAIYIITDGWDNVGGFEPEEIKTEIEKAIRSEDVIESCITCLIGVGIVNEDGSEDVGTIAKLEDFQKRANLTKFINVGDASPSNLAKLTNWISKSVSSQSQHLGSKAPSQLLTF